VQARRFADLLADFDRDSLIVAGDFNLTPWSFALRRGDARLGLRRLSRALATWPAGPVYAGVALPFPVLPIDHVYAGRAWRVVSLKRGPRLGSDHYPVVVVLTR
jgi:endonuclease/exonuclease/phosphatase (EEP) superfamily protein YafD